MVNRSKDKGTKAETAVVDYLRTQGYGYAERRPLNGNTDRGDITGMPGVVIEVKAAARYEIGAWLRETEIERVNARADIGVLLVKPVGVGVAHTADWWAIQPLGQWLDLLPPHDHGRTR